MSEEKSSKDLREDVINQAISSIEKKYGKGAIMYLSQDVLTADIEVIKTGSVLLNIALGVGGFPRGRVVEIFGPEASGKTTIALHAIAEAQKQGGIAAFVDTEHALDPSYASKIGVQIDRLLISQPGSAEEALDIVDALVRTGGVDIVVLDSVAALVPQMELEGGMSDSYIGLQARLMSQALRRLTAYISKTKTVAIFVNQLREKIAMAYGPSETTPGGRALKFYASVRLDVRRREYLRSGDEIIGALTRIKVVKNKVASPFKEAELELIYGEGISQEGEILSLGETTGVVKKSGSWFSFGEYRLGQGRDNARQFLKENPEVAKEILSAALSQMEVDPVIAFNS
ncbi:MAG TPA: recombinase RecA [Candidatus Atribacteria bacterium]|jgi:recombination protein RecA|uniref:recombinase RecA n=1 Tax=Candidatus Sordicultor fermentans TaxID=1953203 RepID=UPI0016A836ED|nr:recombinase RecA [Atribacterota bacterium]NLY05236.1 recombinase RecA [Candidatus Atribacteria bacterium]MDI9608529.1 recombinase RecA [Atribacterota bacterium]HOA98876.1 recombinase RecA [Candidatus Atribacteria bacterium]HOQ51091.1 recombinase RecA [Candidatus Atribacteria bacterium]